MSYNNSNKNLAVGAIIASLYAALTLGQEMLFPGSASAAIQFRISESLMILALFTPAAIPGLTIGCALSNLILLGALPLDVLLGTLATLLSAIAMKKLKDVVVFDLPVAALLMPAIFNGIIIGLEIELFFIKGPFHFSSFIVQAGLVALGELAVCFTLGTLLYKIIKNKKLQKYIN